MVLVSLVVRTHAQDIFHQLSDVSPDLGDLQVVARNGSFMTSKYFLFGVLPQFYEYLCGNCASGHDLVTIVIPDVGIEAVTKAFEIFCDHGDISFLCDILACGRGVLDVGSSSTQITEGVDSDLIKIEDADLATTDIDASGFDKVGQEDQTNEESENDQTRTKVQRSLNKIGNTTDIDAFGFDELNYVDQNCETNDESENQTRTEVSKSPNQLGANMEYVPILSPLSSQEVKKRENDLLFNCIKCEKTFGTQKKVSRHMREVHNVTLSERKGGNYVCDSSNCGRIYTNLRELRFCKCKTKKRTRMKNSDKAQDPWNKSACKCKICEKNFDNRTNLRSHIIYKHKMDYVKDYISSYGDPDACNPKWSCGLCSSSVKFERKRISSHLAQHNLDITEYEEMYGGPGGEQNNIFLKS
eukprot:GFUD01106672.1.p1 GENE.GFUD01106672.1~~GFUD01106672.1.p1  ORF type:complete len:413 (+),score=94.62 GFUD01106672.1:45-1283(+)